jgi:hypothetical protein
MEGPFTFENGMDGKQLQEIYNRKQGLRVCSFSRDIVKCCG